MKKKLTFLGVILLIPLMTACGNNKNELKCTEKLVDEIVIREYTYEFNNNDELENVFLEEVIDFSKVEDLSEMDCGTIEECMKEAHNEFNECENDSYYEECKISKETKTGLTITSKLSKKGIEAIKEDLSVDKLTKEVINKNVKDREMICK